MEKKNISSMFSCTHDMKRSPSEIALEELFKHASVEEQLHNNHRDNKSSLGATNRGGDNGCFVFENGGGRSFDGVSCPNTGNQDVMTGFPSCGTAPDTTLWSQNLTPKNSSITVTNDSQSSICVGSPTSAAKPKARDNQATSGSSHDQSDDDDIDIDTEAGPCEQSKNPLDVKRIKRMVSNRESARRSRRRKQAQLADLEQQVEQLRGENSSLFKQLADATQQFKDATTNNRVLKSNVEALRAKVKLAEDMVARGSLTSNLSHLLQNYLNNPLSSNNINMSPTVTVHGDDTTFPGSSFGLENLDNFIGSIKNNGVISDSVSCVSEIWPWESHIASVSK